MTMNGEEMDAAQIKEFQQGIGTASPYGHLHLRDLFAAFAMAGILSQPNGNPLGNPHDLGLRWCAATAYDLADAMLAQRNEKLK
jgi:hypothetical protein